MINFKEISEGETWELFARDFLSELGFYIVSSPDRGPDGGKDMLCSEDLKGALSQYRFNWLVSCKNFASSERSVTEQDEQNIFERLEAFNADGFIGFYSTVPSSGLNARLHSLRANGKIKDYKIFDHRLIENHLIRVGYSNLLMRYFPESYKAIKPLRLITSEYIPLKCKNCNVDLLEMLYRETYSGNVIFLEKQASEEDYFPVKIEDIFWVCKSRCNDLVERNINFKEYSTSWEDIGDLVIPTFFLRFFFSVMNSIREGKKIFSDQAYENMKTFIMALSQKVLREATAKEQDRIKALIEISSLFS